MLQDQLFYQNWVIYRSDREVFISALFFEASKASQCGRGLTFLLLSTLSRQEETKGLPLVKQEKVERDDCNLDLKVEVNIRSECGLSTGEGGS